MQSIRNTATNTARRQPAPDFNKAATRAGRGTHAPAAGPALLHAPLRAQFDPVPRHAAGPLALLAAPPRRQQQPAQAAAGAPGLGQAHCCSACTCHGRGRHSGRGRAVWRGCKLAIREPGPTSSASTHTAAPRSRAHWPFPLAFGCGLPVATAQCWP